MKKYTTSFAALAIAAAACTHPKLQEEKKETFVLSDTMLKSTKTAPVVQQVLKNELRFFGKITADNNKLIEIFPVVGGNVVKVLVELGDFVQKGQLLATVRSTEVAGFEKELQDAGNDVLIGEKNLKAAQELFEGRLNTDRDVAEAKSQLEKARSQLNRVKETYSIYHLKQGSTYEVRSPISGFIVQKNINQDMQLRSDRTDNIFDIAQIDDVWALANVSESDINKVKLGVDAQVTTISYGDRAFRGKVDKIFNVIDPDTKSMKVRIKLENPGYLLKPEMRASILLSFPEDQKMLSVPAGALIFERSRYFVMVFKSRYRIETREVKVFRQVGETAYISDGLKEGDQVITQNQLLIYDALND
ncbi:efflux RND transporter periplasmic adaptor subunit [Pedobacter sp. SYP-B3415]|uniref:efflux RND transporter periplasmic adaptor subunit n=1 Tax=Pedobacter sp. SYP-B3415 TaxID=2496641 RepID=UPI00101D5A14|nr:efflux RND transporter periplasmic adaptor subunit [Pedobacter sp. SYP-B3415]